jgi:hypothetical protein
MYIGIVDDARATGPVDSLAEVVYQTEARASPGSFCVIEEVIQDSLGQYQRLGTIREWTNEVYAGD